MKANSLIEFLDAAVDTKYVQGPYEERGGIMLVAYPGSLKSTIVKAGLKPHIDAMVLSDLNVQQWLKIREDFVTERYSCLGFTDYEKIYQRHSSTSSHIEGVVKGLVAEGYGVGPSGDTRMPVIPAHALVVGAMTNTCLEEHYDQWSKSGFLRRFLWITFTLKNRNKIAEAIRRWEKIDLGRVSSRPASSQIEMRINGDRSPQLERMLNEQAGFNGTAYVLLKKIAAVLEWRYANQKGGKKKVTDMLDELAPAFSKDGTRLVL